MMFALCNLLLFLGDKAGMKKWYDRLLKLTMIFCFN